jgi:putative phage-type endonuclease
MNDNIVMNDKFEIHEQVKKLLALPQYEQRSAEWFAQRKNKLTSSDLDTVLGRNKYSTTDEVLFRKCGIEKPFAGNIATRHGQKYEDEAIDIYCKKYNKKSYPFGLIAHPTISWLGGSPDDITHDGIVIEVKCPFQRKIIMGEIPTHYLTQVLMNMEICNLDKAVFIEYRPASMCDNNEMIMNIVHIDRDPNWINTVLPPLEKFWNAVLHYRKNGIENHPDYDYHFNRCKIKTKISFGNTVGVSRFSNDVPESGDTTDED